MNKTASKIKEIVKKTVTEKPSFGTDPMEPWSAKYKFIHPVGLVTGEPTTPLLIKFVLL